MLAHKDPALEGTARPYWEENPKKGGHRSEPYSWFPNRASDVFGLNGRCRWDPSVSSREPSWDIWETERWSFGPESSCLSSFWERERERERERKRMHGTSEVETDAQRGRGVHVCTRSHDLSSKLRRWEDPRSSSRMNLCLFRREHALRTLSKLLNSLCWDVSVGTPHWKIRAWPRAQARNLGGPAIQPAAAQARRQHWLASKQFR
ncbi:hypothetical protein LZ30DRAFT_30818 [Colletotrichum cereale]|nr:hypothetical protein LZ30DRAFT_30818 [Colletotrichum cereale]